jgi:hypothetical protein
MAAENISAHVRHLRTCRLFGRWEQSRLYSESMTLEEKIHPHIALEVGWNYFSQGYIRIALDVVDHSLVRWRNSWCDKTALHALALARAFFKVLCWCRLKEALGEALSIQAVDSPLPENSALLDMDVRFPYVGNTSCG